MEQLCFFPEAGMSKGLPVEMLEYRPGLIDPQKGDELLANFIRDTPWKQSTQKMWEKEYLPPRLTAWYGDVGTDYSVAADDRLGKFRQVRSFDIRNKQDHKEHYSVRLEHGSFLLMKAGLQEAFEHRIANPPNP